MTHHDDLHDADLAPLADRLRTQRPQLTAIELDELKRTVRGRVAARPARRRTRSEFMKSRLAILSMLVFGTLFSTTGVGLAINGLGDGSNASVAQYGTPTPTPEGAALGEQQSHANNGDNDNSVVAGERSQPSTLQPARQVEAGATGSSGTLPFTGFLAIPVLLGGVALLAGGLVMRRHADGKA
jgi:hypothetical protein